MTVGCGLWTAAAGEPSEMSNETSWTDPFWKRRWQQFPECYVSSSVCNFVCVNWSPRCRHRAALVIECLNISSWAGSRTRRSNGRHKGHRVVWFNGLRVYIYIYIYIYIWGNGSRGSYRPQLVNENATQFHQLVLHALGIIRRDIKPLAVVTRFVDTWVWGNK